MATPDPESTEKIVAQVTIHVVKGANFRTVHVDGFGLQPDLRNGVRLSFYNDRVAYDERIVNTTNDKGQTTSTNTRETSDIFERELEVEIALPLGMLASLHNEIVKYLAWVKEGMPPQTPQEKEPT